jgi:hypothetical protein
MKLQEPGLQVSQKLGPHHRCQYWLHPPLQQLRLPLLLCRSSAH